MSVIYEPKGRAKEYCELGLNLYKGCSHGCTYCYVPKFTRQNRKTFREKATAREGIIEKLKKRAPKYTGREIHLSFSTDSYQPIDAELKLTRKAIEILNRNGISVTILTKGGTRSIRDFDLLSKNKNKYGTTLTFINDEDSLRYEPGAALPGERIAALKRARSKGIETWVSLEPVIKPEQTLELIRRSKDYVDTFKVGRWNHDKAADRIDWKGFLKDAINILERYQLKYYIKKDLLLYKDSKQASFHI